MGNTEKNMKKQDLAMIRQMKREEEKARQAKKVEEVSPEESKEVKVAFDVWWAAVSKKMNFPFYIKEIVWADFQSRGLKKEEAVHDYVEAIKSFGYKVD
jgi:hypothetical protein